MSTERRRGRTARGRQMTIEFDIRISDHRTPADERARLLENPRFGQLFTDHMITIRWDAEHGWHDARLEAYAPLTLDPATAVFHYAQELFEGLKAYRQGGRSRGPLPPSATTRRFQT